MKAPLNLVTRDVVTPVTIILFIVSTVTGIMLMLHWKGGLVRESHEWLSIVFSIIAIWHLIKNWQSFTQYLKRSPALVAFGASLLISLVFTGMTGSDRNINPRAVFMALSVATLEHTAPAFGLTTDEAVAKLKAAGFKAAPGETLNVIGKRAGRIGPEIVSLLAQKKRR